jgi:hypothetical protein
VENFLLTVFFMQISKRETRSHIVHLLFPICETRLVSSRLPSTCTTLFRSLVSPRLLVVVLASF